MEINHAYTVIEPDRIKLQKGRGPNYDPSKFDLTSVVLPLKYPNGVKLKPDKITDLRYLVRFVPPDHTGFYEALFEGQERM